jgi:thiol-disulfide isomerase/thioredoxin
LHILKLSACLTVAFLLAACAIALGADTKAVKVELSPVDIRSAVKDFRLNTSLVALDREPLLPANSLPALSGDALYGSIRLGPKRTLINIAVETKQSGTSDAAYRVYIDGNANGTLADDSPSEWLKLATSEPEHGEAVARTKDMAIRLDYALIIGERNYLKYSNVTGRAGSIASDGPKARFVIIDMNGDGCYDGSDDVMVVDLNGDGVLDGGPDSLELMPLYQDFVFGDIEWSLAELQSSGASVKLTKGDLAAVVEFTPPPAGETKPQIGFYAPHFEEKVASGKSISLGAYRGKVVLLDFWATWCGPCRVEVPHLIEAYKQFRGKGFEIIGISLDTDLDRMQAYTKAQKMDWPQVFDGRNREFKLANLYNVAAIPATFLVGRDGRIVATDLRGGKLAEAIECAL